MSQHDARPRDEFSGSPSGFLRTGFLFVLFLCCSNLISAQSGSTDWPSQNLNVHNSRYSELTALPHISQIVTNFSKVLHYYLH